MTEVKVEPVTFTNFEDAIKFIDSLKIEAQTSTAKWAQAVKDLTGHNINEPVSAIDVVSIVAKVFGVSAKS